MDKTSEDIELKIIQLYNDGFGTNEISTVWNVHRATVQRILLRNNIKLRKRSPVKYNVHFFDNYTIESCYWAGFIAADGTIRSDRDSVEIHLSKEDSSHLDKIAKATNFTGNIRVGEKDCCISFAGEWFKKSLENNFDLTSRKSMTVFVSDKIPKNMMPHYLRGYFDGDGCISQTNNYLHISFTSGSKRFLNQVIEIIYDLGIKVRNKSEKPKIQRYSIHYFCKNAYYILKFLYESSTDLTRLNRKYLLYTDRISEFELKTY